MSVTNARTRSTNVVLSEEIKQQKFTTKVPDKGTGDMDAFRDKIEQAKNMVLQTMILSSKYQILGDEKGNKSADMLNSIATIAQFDMDEIQLIQSMKTADLQQKAAFAQTSQMVGQRVSIDDSVRNFSGSPVNFRYEILGKSVPDGATIQTQISVMTSDGKKVFSETKSGGKLGKNTFAWAGRDEHGDKVANGDYNIVVSASYTIPGQNTSPLPLTTSTSKNGTLDKIEIDDSYNINYIVDGTRYSADAIKSLARGDANDKDESQKPISEYMGYVGKTVDIQQNKINFNGGSAQVPFISKKDIKEATVKVEFLDDSGKFVAYSEGAYDIKTGPNNFIWKGWDAKSADEFQKMNNKELDIAHVPVGVYTYQVTIINKDQNGAEVETKLDNKGSYVIDTIDKSSGRIVFGSDNYRFDARDVQKISEAAPTKASFNQMLQEGANLVGKFASYTNDTLNYDGKTNAEMFFSIPPLAGTTIGDARINIIDEKGATVATITKAAADLYAEDSVPVPQIANANDVKTKLSIKSAIQVRKYWDNTFPGANISTPTSRQTMMVQKYIENEFRNGRIAEISYDTLPTPDEQKKQLLKNAGLIPITWDGKTTAGSTAKAGKYKYNIEYDRTNATSGATTTTTTSRNTSGGILFTRIGDDGEMILGLEGGIEIPTSRVTKLGAMRE